MLPASAFHVRGTAPRFGVIGRRIRTVLWFVVWAIVGLAVAHGPLNRGLSLSSLLIAGAIGLVMALLVHRSMVSRRSTRKWQFRFVWPARLLLVYLLIIVILQLHATGAFPAVRRDYGYQFDRLADAIAAHHPTFAELQTEWPTLRERYRARAEQATDDTMFLAAVSEMLSHFPGSYVVSDAHGLQDLVQANRGVVRAEVLPLGVGYIEVNSFGRATDADKLFDEALAHIGEVPALIIDLRRNVGGSIAQAHRIAAHFIAEPFTYATVSFRHRLPHFGWVRELTYTVSPRDEVYKGPVVVLVGGQTMGAAEALTFAMKESGRAVVVGEATAGAAGVSIGFHLPGGTVQIPVGYLDPLGGPSIEGVGVQPDVLVAPAMVEGPDNEDVALMAAIDYLIQRL